jgi:glycosyltransferase 2 family protein
VSAAIAAAVGGLLILFLGTRAVLAIRVRFFQQQGYDASVALSPGAIMTSASRIAIVVLFVCSLPFAWGSIHLKATPQSGFDPELVWIALTVVVVVVARVAGLAMAVPRLRKLAAEQIRPRTRQIWVNLKQVIISPRKLVLLATGSFAQPLLAAMALSVSPQAFGDHLWLPVPDRGHHPGPDHRGRLAIARGMGWWKRARSSA